MRIEESHDPVEKTGLSYHEFGTNKMWLKQACVYCARVHHSRIDADDYCPDVTCTNNDVEWNTPVNSALAKLRLTFVKQLAEDWSVIFPKLADSLEEMQRIKRVYVYRWTHR